MNKTKVDKTEKRINELMNKFNFERVHDVMVFLDWRWAPSFCVPNIAQLKDEARKLLGYVVGNENTADLSTGGLYVKQYKDGQLHLSFIVEQHTAL